MAPFHPTLARGTTRAPHRASEAANAAPFDGRCSLGPHDRPQSKNSSEEKTIVSGGYDYRSRTEDGVREEDEDPTARVERVDSRVDVQLALPPKNWISVDERRRLLVYKSTVAGRRGRERVEQHGIPPVGGLTWR